MRGQCVQDLQSTDKNLLPAAETRNLGRSHDWIHMMTRLLCIAAHGMELVVNRQNGFACC